MVSIPRTIAKEFGIQPGWKLDWKLGSNPDEILVRVIPDRAERAHRLLDTTAILPKPELRLSNTLAFPMLTLLAMATIRVEKSGRYKAFPWITGSPALHHDKAAPTPRRLNAPKEISPPAASSQRLSEIERRLLTMPRWFLSLSSGMASRQAWRR